MEENLFNRLVYVDHNVLDRMTKGEYLGLIEYFNEKGLIAAYSSESLNEIKRSVGFENSFLDILKTMGARYVVPDKDENFRYVGTAQVHECDPFEVYRSFLNEYEGMPEHGYGLTSMLKKMYGGMTNMSFTEIFENGVKETLESIQISDSDIDALELSYEEKENIKEYLRFLPELLEQEYSELGTMLDRDSGDSSVKDLEELTGLGPKVLKNISGKNLLIQVWEHVQKRLPVSDQSLEKFFGLEQASLVNETDRELSVVEKVNSIYHQLNYVGFYRDSNMKKDRRFVASFSDMTHAGMATFCRLFFCRDEDLVMKAAAAYEYLRLPTQIVHIKANNGN